MPLSFTELIYAAVTNANRGAPVVVANAEFTAQTLFPVVSQSVSEAAARNEYKRSLLRREKTITLVNGEALLDADILTHYIPDSTLIDPANLTKVYSWRDYPDFIRRNQQVNIQRKVGEYTLIGGDRLQVIEPNGLFTVPLTATGVRTLVTPCVVVAPANASDPVDAPDEILSDILEALAEAIQGNVPRPAGVAASAGEA